MKTGNQSLFWVFKMILRNNLVHKIIFEYNPDSTRYQKNNYLKCADIEFDFCQLIFTRSNSIVFTCQTHLVKCKFHCHFHRSPCRLKILKFITRENCIRNFIAQFYFQSRHLNIHDNVLTVTLPTGSTEPIDLILDF